MECTGAFIIAGLPVNFNLLGVLWYANASGQMTCANWGQV